MSDEVQWPNEDGSPSECPGCDEVHRWERLARSFMGDAVVPLIVCDRVPRDQLFFMKGKPPRA